LEGSCSTVELHPLKALFSLTKELNLRKPVKGIPATPRAGRDIVADQNQKLNGRHSLFVAPALYSPRFTQLLQFVTQLYRSPDS
jgi:hypothetical protein